MEAPNAAAITWLFYPDSRVELTTVGSESATPLIDIRGNQRGLASLSAAFLWLSSFAEDHEFLSVSGLPFVVCHSQVAFSIAIDAVNEGPAEGRIVLLDNKEQFRWYVDDEALQQVACCIHAIACQPMRGYFDAELACDSQARLTFQILVD